MEAITMIGNSGSGKSYLLNKLSGSNFITGASGDSVTTKLEWFRSTDFKEVIVDIPGIFEADSDKIRRNQKCLDEIILRYLRIKYLVVFSANQGGRVQEKDISIIRFLLTSYDGVEDPHIIINNCPNDSIDYQMETKGVINELLGMEVSMSFIHREDPQIKSKLIRALSTINHVKLLKINHIDLSITSDSMIKGLFELTKIRSQMSKEKQIYIEATQEADYKMVKSCSVTCYYGCRLTMMESQNHICDVCRRTITPGSSMSSCRPHDYDICNLCNESNGFKLIMHPHTLEYLALRGRCCDECGERISYFEYSAKCINCNYDICNECMGFKPSEHPVMLKRSMDLSLAYWRLGKISLEDMVR